MKKFLLIMMCLATPILANCQNNQGPLIEQQTIIEEDAALKEINSFFENFKSKYSNIILRRRATTPAGEIIAEYKNPLAQIGPKPGKQNKKVEVRLIKGKK